MRRLISRSSAAVERAWRSFIIMCLFWPYIKIQMCGYDSSIAA